MSYIERNEATKRLRKALKAKTGKSWSVWGDRGTAYGWITVEAPKARRVSEKLAPQFASIVDVPLGTPVEEYLIEYTGPAGTNDYTSLADRKILANIFKTLNRGTLRQGLSISPDSREWYVQRAEA